MNDTNADFGKAAEDLLRVMTDLLGEQAGQRLKELLDEVDWRELTNAPETWQAQFNAEVADALAGSEVDDAAVLRLLPKLSTMRKNAEAEASTRNAAYLTDQPAARYLAEHLVLLARQVGPDHVLPLLPEEGTLAGVHDVLGGSPGLGRMISTGAESPDSVTFEESVKAIAGSLAHASERIYRPLLAAAFSVTQAGNRNASSPPDRAWETSCRVSSALERHPCGSPAIAG